MFDGQQRVAYELVQVGIGLHLRPRRQFAAAIRGDGVLISDLAGDLQSFAKRNQVVVVRQETEIEH